ncbi:MAG: hypothetical protein WC169_04705 [Dehalococcoidia bacterium]|jgi:predicted component of type VI protein secretion system
MATDQFVSRPYEDQELLSIDRLKRAVMNRIIERAEALMDEEFPLKDERLGQLFLEEWENAKVAVRNSPQAKEAYKKWLESKMTGLLDSQIKEDRDELNSMGVQEKSL